MLEVLPAEFIPADQLWPEHDGVPVVVDIHASYSALEQAIEQLRLSPAYFLHYANAAVLEPQALAVGVVGVDLLDDLLGVLLVEHIGERHLLLVHFVERHRGHSCVVFKYYWVYTEWKSGLVDLTSTTVLGALRQPLRVPGVVRISGGHCDFLDVLQERGIFGTCKLE